MDELEASDPDGTTLPGREWLAYYVEHGRVVLGMSTAQNERLKLELKRPPSAPPADPAADVRLIAGLLESMPDRELLAELERRQTSTALVSVDQDPTAPTGRS